MSEPNPYKLNDNLIDRIARLIDTGMSINAVCDAVGVSRASFYQWMSLGSQPDRSDIYVRFVTEIRKARAGVQARWLEKIEIASQDPKTWTAAAWLLERSFPQEFGRRSQVDVTVREDVVAEIERLSEELGVFDPTKELEE
jgi:orotate phosphoribosyltransferase-like protein